MSSDAHKYMFSPARLFIKVTDMNPAISEDHSSCIECVCNYISAIKREAQSALMSGSYVVGNRSESHFLGVYGANVKLSRLLWDETDLNLH